MQTMEQCISLEKKLVDHILEFVDIISNREHMLYVFEGLDSNYISLITNITNKKQILSLNDIFTCLRMHERQCKCMNLPYP